MASRSSPPPAEAPVSGEVSTEQKAEVAASKLEAREVSGHGSCVTWSRELEDLFLEECRRVLTFSARKELERRVRAGTGTEFKTAKHCCGGSSSHSQSHESHCAGLHAASEYRFCKDPDDEIGKRLDYWTGTDGLREVLPETSERAAKVYGSVVSKAAKDGLVMEKGSEEDKHLHSEILKEALVREVHARIAQQMRQDRLLDSREGGLLANPSAYKEGPLCSLESETMKELMTRGFAVQKNFLGKKTARQILEELEMIDFDGRFNEVRAIETHAKVGMENLRSDFMCWITLADLDREKHQAMRRLLNAMFSLPFEINKKANLCLQVAGVCEASVFPVGASYRPHVDGGFSKIADNGRKITAVYFPNAENWTEADGGLVRLYRRRTRKEQLEAEAKAKLETLAVQKDEMPEREVLPSADTLLLFRSGSCFKSPVPAPKAFLK